MAWGTLHDGVVDHPKFVALASACGLSPLEALAAVGLWTKANGWCHRNRTDGHVPKGLVPQLAGLPPAKALRLAAALVAARGMSKHGLWEEVEGGYQVHDYTEYNWSKERIETKRAAGRLGGQRSGESRQARAQALASSTTEAPASRVLHQSGEAGAQAIEDVDVRTPPSPSRGAQAGATDQQPPGLARPYRWPDVLLASLPGFPRWHRWPPEAMRFDCADPAYRGRCVNPAWSPASKDHPRPALRQCPEHRAQRVAVVAAVGESVP